MVVSRECSEMVGRLAKREDDAWCEGFMEAWNTQACDRAAAIERIEELETMLEETLRSLAEMQQSFEMLADMMRAER